MYIGQRMVVNPRFLPKFKKIKDEKRAATEMEKSTENVDNDDNDVDKKRQQMEEVVSYEYYGAAEPPVRCGESHLSGLTEPLRSL